jgi:hypothetical protein
MLRPEPLADLEPLSVMEFVLLPGLRVEGTDAPMTEGDEALITVSCDVPLLADEEDRPTNVLPLACVSQASFDNKVSCVRAEPIHKTVRLTYPPTKVILTFVPKLFATRLVCNGRARSRPQLTYAEAKTGYLAILALPNRVVLIVGPGLEESISTDSEGRGCYSLANLLPAIRHERTWFEVVCGDGRQRFQIVWHASLQFDAEQSHLDTESDECGTLLLHFDAKGPPDTKVAFKLADNRFRSHGQQVFSLAELGQGAVELPIDVQKLKSASIL